MNKRVYRFDWAGAAVFVLSLSLGIGFAGTLIIISGPWDPDPLSDAGATLLSTIGGVLAGAVAAYFGVHAERSANGRQTEITEQEDN